jgi:transposase
MKLEVLKRSNRRHAYIVFIDEAGFILSPHLRRTWALRGCTPIIRVAEPHGRISVVGAISISPKKRVFRFHFLLSADNANFHGYSLVTFLEFLRGHIPGPITLIWDQIAIHRAAPIIKYLHKHRRIVVEPFPQYAPELNPVDYAWGYVKCARLANYTPPNLVELRAQITKEFRRLQHRPDLLRSFFNHAGLTLDIQKCYGFQRSQNNLKSAGHS